jgi:hypothetical protein
VRAVLSTLTITDPVPAPSSYVITANAHPAGLTDGVCHNNRRTRGYCWAHQKRPPVPQKGSIIPLLPWEQETFHRGAHRIAALCPLDFCPCAQHLRNRDSRCDDDSRNPAANRDHFNHVEFSDCVVAGGAQASEYHRLPRETSMKGNGVDVRSPMIWNLTRECENIEAAKL